MNTPGDELQFFERMNQYNRQHRAGQWSGTFSHFMESVLAQAPQQVARTSHQYIWDMIRATSEADAQGRLHCRLSCRWSPLLTAPLRQACRFKI